MNESTLAHAIECQICMEPLDTTSKVLPLCGHSFHKKCLEDWARVNQELRCPGCRTLVDVGIDKLPPNVVLNNILESKGNSKKESASKIFSCQNEKSARESAALLKVETKKEATKKRKSYTDDSSTDESTTTWLFRNRKTSMRIIFFQIIKKYVWMCFIVKYYLKKFS